MVKQASGENVDDIPGDQPYVRMQEGFLWEYALELMAGGMGREEAMDVAFKRYMVNLRGHVVKQIAVERDGIQMTPDGFSPQLGELESYKCTRRSLSNAKTAEEFENNFWIWMMQEKSYCLAVGVDTVRWIVLWQAGDYGKGLGTGPQVLQATAKFSTKELLDNWKAVCKHAERARKLGLDKVGH